MQILAKGVFKILPVFLYALGEQPLSNENMEELRNLKETYPYNPVLFVSALAHISLDSLEGDFSLSDQRRLQSKNDSSESSSTREDSVSMTSTSTQDDSLKSNSTKELDKHCDLDKMNSLGVTWLDQLTDLGFLSESADADNSSWISSSRSSNSSDILDSCKKLGNVHVKFITNV